MKKYICKEDLVEKLKDTIRNLELEDIESTFGLGDAIEVVENLPTASKTDIINDFIEDDLYPMIMRIMYCNNKEIGKYILTNQLFHEIGCLLAEMENEE